MKTQSCLPILACLGLLSSLACDSNAMDKDLKRQADRATIKLNRVETERDALQVELTKARAEIAKSKADADASSREADVLRQRLSRIEADLLQARQKIRELEDAALAARQGMPTTRKPQP
jgi:peptidoglycan hydrolase CwlO-like protein